MSKLWSEFRENELLRRKSVSYKTYKNAKETLSEDEFYERYGEDKSASYFECYYEKEYIDITPEEMSDYIAYESIKSQRKSEAYLKSIKNILVFSVIAAIVCFLIIISPLI